MREYELTVIVQPDLEEAARNEALERLQEYLVSAGAIPDTIDPNHWGQRSLAYPIKNYLRGYYVFYEVALDPEKTTEMERNLMFREEILRHLLVRKES